MKRWQRTGVADLVVLAALTAIPLLAGAAQSGLLSPRDAVLGETADRASVASIATEGFVAFEGSVLLTESPVANEFVSQSIKRSKKRAQRSKPTSEQIASGRSGLVKTKQSSGNSIFVFYPSDEYGDSSSVFPVIPGDEKRYQRRLGPSGTFRTLCVRLCDGYYWPVSFSTTRAGIAEDKQTCESSCGVPVKLFYYQNPDGTPEEAVDLKGERYASLTNAFRYRSEYVESCKCQPDPWEAASLQRHQKYAQLMKEGKLALWDKRKPAKKRKRQILVGFDTPTVTTLINPQAATSSADLATPKTTITSTKGKKRKSTLSVESQDGEQANLDATMGITKVGQSTSGKTYSAKKKSASDQALTSRR